MKKTMKNRILMIITSLFFLLSINTFAQSASATAEAHAYATIITPITLTKTADMYFGNIVAGTSAGTVILAVNDTRTKTGDVILPTATPGTITSAKFTTTGLANATYAITLPSSINLSTNGDNGNGNGHGNPHNDNDMIVNGFNSIPAINAGVLTDGSQDISVGATLNVNANQAPGEYQGTFNVTVCYN
jgi:hypothetical protein